VLVLNISCLRCHVEGTRHTVDGRGVGLSS
jgi:hypothetical protein